MTFTAAQIAMLINGTTEGDASAAVASFGKIEEAQAGQLAFLANPKYEDFLYSTAASVIIVNETQELRQPVTATLIRVPDAYTAFATLLAKYQEIISQQMVGIQEPSYIAKTARLGDQVYVAALAYIGENVVVGNHVKIFPHVFLGDNVRIGDHTVLHPGVKIYHDCVLGKNITVHAGTVIGSDGFGFAPQTDGSFKKVPQIGNVVIEDHVEIGANAAIDRATMGSTIIRRGAKLDNLIQIAHNVEIGSSSVIAAQAGISGSTKLGSGVMIGGQAGIAGHLQLADGSKVNAQAGLGKSLKANAAVTGSPAYNYNQAIRAQAMARNLPEIEKRLQELEQLVKHLLKAKENV
ncbi:MAG: UDP-3-O-(3-hydroxymyristoyl)glucosamine N-acyltransferase [Chitinophagaceae bacterium]